MMTLNGNEIQLAETINLCTMISVLEIILTV
jgi:hypothetical protein